MGAPIYLLRVFTFGLIAYVTNNENPSEIKMLLVDARHPPVASDGCPITKHEPLLVYSPYAGGCNDWCRLEMGVCRCPLERVRVLFDQMVFPDDAPVDQGDMKYVPSLLNVASLPKLTKRGSKTLGNWLTEAWTRRIDKSCLYEDADTRVCPFVAAEVSFTPERVRTCEMALGMQHFARTATAEHYAPPGMADPIQSGRPFAFRSPSQNEFEIIRKQHIAIKQVMARDLSCCERYEFEMYGYIEVPVVSFDNTEYPKPIRIYPVKCPENNEWTARPQDQGNPPLCFDIAIANVPLHARQHLLYGRCQGHGIDRDFELFEDLSVDQQDMEDREVPFDRGMPMETGLPRDALCNSVLLEDFNRWLRTDQATSECSGGKIRN